MSTFDEAFEFLDVQHPFIATFVARLGKPLLDDSVPSAAIRFNEASEGGWEFVVSPKFFEQLSPEEGAGVLVHESLHVILDHLNESMSGHWENAKALMIAHEIIINDRLEAEGIALPTGDNKGMDGASTIGRSAALYSTTEAYNAVLETLSPENLSTIHSDCKSGLEGASDESVEQAIESLQDLVGDFLAEANSGSLQQQTDEDDLSDSFMESVGVNPDVDQTINRGIGDSGGSTMQKLSEKLDASLAWTELLAEVNPDVLKMVGKSRAKMRPDWSGPRRSLAHVYPQVMVPRLVATRQKSTLGDPSLRPLIIIAFDFSGSIPRSMTKVLEALAESIPSDLIRVECCTFSTQAIEYIPRAKNNRIASGGTSFSCVEDFAKAAAKKHGVAYPKSIVCTTDGMAHFRTPPANKNSWTWLLINKTDRLYPASMFKPEQIKQLSAFAKF